MEIKVVNKAYFRVKTKSANYLNPADLDFNLLYVLDKKDAKQARNFVIDYGILYNQSKRFANKFKTFHSHKRRYHNRYFVLENKSVWKSLLLKYCYFQNKFIVVYENDINQITKLFNQHCLKTDCSNFSNYNFCKFCERENG